MVIFAGDSELKVAAQATGRRNLITVEGGENLLKRLGLVWVKACPKGTGGGGCLIFIHLGQFCPSVSFFATHHSGDLRQRGFDFLVQSLLCAGKTGALCSPSFDTWWLCWRRMPSLSEELGAVPG